MAYCSPSLLHLDSWEYHMTSTRRSTDWEPPALACSPRNLSRASVRSESKVYRPGRCESSSRGLKTAARTKTCQPLRCPVSAPGPNRQTPASSEAPSLAAARDSPTSRLLFLIDRLAKSSLMAVLVGGGTSPPPEGWPAPAPRDSELGLPLQID